MQMWRALAISLIFMVLWYFHTEQVVGSCSTYVICLYISFNGIYRVSPRTQI